MSAATDTQTNGPTELEWAAACDGLTQFVWPRCRRLVVISPHPDDETLGAGGLIGVALERGIKVLVVSVTDGEAAYLAPDLAKIRRAELRNALRALDPAGTIQTVRLGFADSRVADSVAALTGEIARRLDPQDLVVCPLPDDGHPDHHAVSAAATAAARATGANVRWFPIWAWQRHDPRGTVLAHGQRLELRADVHVRKQNAVACFGSQTGGRTPVVPPPMLVRLLRPFEVFVVPR